MNATKNLWIAIFLLCCFSCSNKEEKSFYPYTAVSFTEVELDDTYWAPRIETNRKVTIPFALNKNEETGRMDNFRKASGKIKGPHTGKRYNDTDVFKVLEGVAYSLKVHPDPELEKLADELIADIAAAQEEDGYLMTGRTIDPENPAPGLGKERWIHLQGSHELYNSGHLYEAAVAYFEATGKTNFLDIAIKNADLLLDTFGPDKKHDAPGHQVIEMGLAKLYRTTGNEKYLELVKFFLDQRGKEHEHKPYPDSSVFALYNGDFYMQDHKPVKDQTEAWGHAVRATYMYAGMADVAALTGDSEYQSAIDKIWNNTVSKKLYLTGGVGSRHTTEAFGEDYELPNAEAYNETCAAIGNAFWNIRMFQTHGNAAYIDVLERTMYNGLASGVSLSGDRFFYPNPLESHRNYQRRPWFEVSCCPGNIVRFLPSVPGYIYAKKGMDFFVNLYIQSKVKTMLNGEEFQLQMETDYPWDGNVKITVEPLSRNEFTIFLRIPGWASDRPVPSDLYYFNDSADTDWSVTVNGEAVSNEVNNGYLPVTRRWKKGDIIHVNLPMVIHRVVAHENVLPDRGKVAIQRGPLVYCVEEIDNPHGVFNTVIPPEAELSFRYDDRLLNGTGIIEGKVKTKDGENVDLTAIPYALWANRGGGKMAVWIPEQ
jgi:DUF1680 family protein